MEVGLTKRSDQVRSPCIRIKKFSLPLGQQAADDLIFPMIAIREARLAGQRVTSQSCHR